MKQLFNVFVFSLIFMGCKNEDRKNTDLTHGETQVTQKEAAGDTANIKIDPISHATAVITWDNTTIYLDPVGGAEAFKDRKAADLVLITDIHGDHMDAATLKALELGATKIAVPRAVKEKLPQSFDPKLIVMNNGERIERQGFRIEAIPMYNLREEARQFHDKGRGNGYLLEKDGTRMYIAGDTEDIPEMRNLKDIDIALIPMNLPYTMPVDSAADAVLDFAPKKVYPYHYRGKQGKSDVHEFKRLVNEGNKNIEVILADWYPDDPQQ